LAPGRNPRGTAKKSGEIRVLDFFGDGVTGKVLEKTPKFPPPKKRRKCFVLTWTKGMGWATFRAIFSQAHLATLLLGLTMTKIWRTVPRSTMTG
jgi:hypothetical protein